MVALERSPEPAVVQATPVADAIAPAARHRTASPRQTLAICLIGAAVLAGFAAPDLPGWADRLDDGPGGRLMRSAAEGWASATAQLGLAEPHRLLRRGAEWLLECGWR